MRIAHSVGGAAPHYGSNYKIDAGVVLTESYVRVYWSCFWLVFFREGDIMEWVRAQWNDWARHAWRIVVFGVLVYGLYLAMCIEHHGHVAAENSQWMREQIVLLQVKVQDTEVETKKKIRAAEARADRMERIMDKLLAIGERCDARLADPVGSLVRTLRLSTMRPSHARDQGKGDKQ